MLGISPRMLAPVLVVALAGGLDGYIRACMNETGECKHKRLLPDVDAADIWMTIITFFTIFFSVPVGVGGGGILVSTYMVVGVLFNALCPEWLITLLLVAFFFYVTYKTTIKAVDLYNKEEGSGGAGTPEAQRLLSESKGGEKDKYSGVGREEDPEGAVELQAIFDQDRQTHYKSIIFIVVTWLLTSATSALKGSREHPGVVDCGGFGYWLLVFLPLPVVITLMWFATEELTKIYERKKQLNFQFINGDVEWTVGNTRVFAMYSLAAGFAVGALGIAAGMILGPLLLEMGMLPLVSVATTGFIVLFTSSSTTVQYWFLGLIQADYAILFAMVSVVAGASGNFAVNAVVQHYKKTWIVVAILAVTIGVTNVLTAVTGYYRTVNAWDQGKCMFGLRNLCI